MIEQGKIWQNMVKYGCNMDGIWMEYEWNMNGRKKMEKSSKFGLTDG